MGTAQGCFATRANQNNQCYGLSSGVTHIGSEDGISFDASRSSSIYISNATIRPKAISILVLLKL